MCGIIGVFGELVEEEASFVKMLQTLKHRGPDDAGFIKGSEFLIGHRRLSIIDVEKGHQPLRSCKGDINLACNGEIYNYRKLKKEFAHTYNFSTETDSEVLIPLYQRDGTGLVENLDGMFSFILSGDKEYFVARDPIGIKPLYYGVNGNRMYFASELKALIGHAESLGEFPNGYYFHSLEGFKPYYRLPEIGAFVSDMDLAIAKIRETLRQSVKKRLISDVPVGVFLSGGLDSSIVAALMKEEIADLHSFSVGFSDSPDLKAARQVAEHLGTIHHEFIYSEDEMIRALPEVIYYLESYDPSLVRSAIPCYFVSRLASRYVKVILSGEGSDELFAGYSYFADYDDPWALHEETIRILKSLHNINLQRVDRMTMAHGLEGRVPFLDIGFIEAALSIDPNLKMHSTFNIEKWLLRKTFEDLLPAEIVWRDKMEFAQGCGSSTVFERMAASIDDTELQDMQNQGYPVSSKEEKMYYDLFKQYFNHPGVENLIGSWKGTLH